MPTAKDCSAKKMCSLCPPRKKTLPKKNVRFDSIVDTFSISDTTSSHQRPWLTLENRF
ncbi:unnamed protein product [Acanthoscelides obtectus]|uniref:Uncharacterized protein n=1 Tax=Acanthoscelides obtectus TaxID=200917 RepID=A0A9P0K622_ACAOB|nr:unnamed protein product [Acanthoscelides obtectus]CAK1631622.1 hypothetical protein AOBTE_LOCUS7055 [Acanthoscelides obtectus]